VSGNQEYLEDKQKFYRQILSVTGKEIPVFDIFIYIIHDICRYQTRELKFENYICKNKSIL
jgi:hypothetical protein